MDPEDGLADVAVRRMKLGMPGWECAGGALAVHEQLLGPPVDLMRLELPDVVGHVVDDLQAPAGRPEDVRERLPHFPRDELPVGPGEVGSARHGHPVLRHGVKHRPDEVRRDLMAEATRAGVDHHDHPTGEQAERSRRPLVEDVGDGLDLDEVIPGAHGAELVGAPPLRPRRDVGRIRARKPAARLEVIEIRGVPVPARHYLLGPPSQHRIEVVGPKCEAPPAPDPRRDLPEDRRAESVESRLRLLQGERRAQQPDPAVDVVSDHPGRDDPAVSDGGGRDAADGAAVALVHVRHGQSVAADPGIPGRVARFTSWTKDASCDASSSVSRVA
jgi:hypothetical protein